MLTEKSVDKIVNIFYQLLSLRRASHQTSITAALRSLSNPRWHAENATSEVDKAMTPSGSTTKDEMEHSCRLQQLNCRSRCHQLEQLGLDETWSLHQDTIYESRLHRLV